MKKTPKDKLNINQQKFCELWATDRNFFGSGVESYIEAYSLSKDKYNTAKVNASKLLTKSNVLIYINELLENKGLNNEFVDKQLLFLITQSVDFKSKLGSIKEYNKLKNRITERLDITTKDEKIVSDKEALKIKEEYEQKLKDKISEADTVSIKDDSTSANVDEEVIKEQ